MTWSVLRNLFILKTNRYKIKFVVRILISTVLLANSLGQLHAKHHILVVSNSRTNFIP